MDVASPRWITLRYPGTCHACRGELMIGHGAWWSPATRRVECGPCKEAAVVPLAGGLGEPGASARREYRRRHRRLGLMRLLFGTPRHVKNWKTGAAGEELVGRRLAGLRREDVIVIHDRRVPGTTANLDHIVVAPSGIYVVDTKVDRGLIRLRRRLFAPGPELWVGHRNRTRYVEGMGWQVRAVSRAAFGVDGVQSAPLIPVLCFVGVQWPLFVGRLEFRGVRIVRLRRLVKMVRQPGDLDAAQVADMARRILNRLMAA